MMQLSSLGEDLQVVQEMAGVGVSKHEGHVRLPGEGHREVNFDEG